MPSFPPDVPLPAVPETVIAASSIGALPYYADRPLIDMMGLTEPRIGRLNMERMGQGPAGHEKGDGNYVLLRRPDIVLFDKGHLFDHQASMDEVLRGARGISELELAQSRDFHRRYSLEREMLPQGILHYFKLRLP